MPLDVSKGSYWRVVTGSCMLRILLVSDPDDVGMLESSSRSWDVLLEATTIKHVDQRTPTAHGHSHILVWICILDNLAWALQCCSCSQHAKTSVSSTVCAALYAICTSSIESPTVQLLAHLAHKLHGFLFMCSCCLDIAPRTCAACATLCSYAHSSGVLASVQRQSLTPVPAKPMFQIWPTVQASTDSHLHTCGLRRRLPMEDTSRLEHGTALLRLNAGATKHYTNKQTYTYIYIYMYVCICIHISVFYV